MNTSNIISDHPRLHVRLTQDSDTTQTLKEVRKLAFTMYDRDVMIDLSCIQDLNEHDIIIVLTMELLLREAGHIVTLYSAPDKVIETLSTLGLTKTLHLPEACVGTLKVNI